MSWSPTDGGPAGWTAPAAASGGVHGDAPPTDAAREPLRLRLYVAASAPNSQQALANLRRLLDAADARDAVVEVVDCIREPQRALRDGVLVTPTLLKLGPAPTAIVVGALSDAPAVALALGLHHAALPASGTGADA